MTHAEHNEDWNVTSITKILLKAEEIKRIKYWDVNICFPIHLVIKRDFSQALMDKDKTIVCLQREFGNTEHIIFGLASENTNALQETETYFRLFQNVRKEKHFRTVLSICFNSYFNPVKYLYDELKLISSRQKR